MDPLPKATPALAKTVWQCQRWPSARSVARSLTQSGRPVHYTTVSRWRRSGWRADPTAHPLDKARADLESALPLVTGNPATTIEELFGVRPSRDELEQLTDAQLLKRAAASLPVGERDHFLQSVATHLTGAPTDDAVIAAINAALDAAATAGRYQA
jgi:hypothetical protein